MRKKYLVLQDIRDNKSSPGSYAVLSVIELDERIVKAVDCLQLPRGTANRLRETLDKHTPLPPDKK